MEERARNDGSRISTAGSGEGRAAGEGRRACDRDGHMAPESEPGMSYVIFLPDILTGVPVPLEREPSAALTPFPS